MSDVLSKKDRPFVGRHDLIAAFSKAVENKKPDEHKILNFHGAAGIGKSTLLEKLIEELADIDGDARWALLNFETRSFRDMETALFKLRQDLKKKYKIEFPAFDIAYAVYWRKTRPQIPLNKNNFPLWDEAGLLAELIKDAGNIPFVGLLPKLIRLKGKVDDAIYDWQIKRGNELLKKLPEMEPKDIEDTIPSFFAEDLNQYIEGYKYKFLIFFDTYEQLKGKKRSESERFGSDKWVRELIDRVRGALWVISGREYLEWPDLDDKWKNRIEPNKVGDLEPEYADEYLEKCGIENNEIRKVTVEGSKGIPLYLDLSVDTFIEIIKGREALPDDFGKTPREIFERFIRNLDDHEVETLKAISAARFWDSDIFEAIVKHFNTGLPLTRFKDFHRFSFMKPGADDNAWRMHDLLRDAFLEYTDKNIINKSHEFLFEYYNNCLRKIDIKNITDKQKTALGEGFYHGKWYIEPTKLTGWLNLLLNKFDKAAQWKISVDVYEDATAFFIGKFGKENSNIALILNNLGYLYKSLGKYRDAQLLFKESLEIAKKTGGEDNPFFTSILNNLADLFRIQGNYEEAESLYKASLEIKKKALGEDHPGVATVANNLATLYESQGKYKEADQLYRKSLEITKKTLGEDHPDYATILCNLAFLFESQGRDDKAEPLYIESLEIKKKTLGEDHPSVSTTLNNLAALYQYQGKFAKAELLHKKSLEITKKTLGEDHPDYADSLNNLAMLYDSQGRFGDAELLFIKSLEIKKKALGEYHPSVATIANNLAELYKSIGRYDESKLLLKKDLQITKKFLGKDHPHYATALNNLGGLYKAQKRYEEAESLYKESLEITKKGVGKAHANYAATLNNMAELYKSIGRNDESERLYKEALEIARETLGIDHPNYATTLNNLARLYESQGRHGKAERIFIESIEIKKNALGEDHPSVGIMLGSLASFQILQEKYGDAESGLKRALEIFEKNLGLNHPRVATIFELLSILYDKMGRKEEAAECIARAQAIRT